MMEGRRIENLRRDCLVGKNRNNMQDMGSEAGTTPKKDMGTKVNIVTCTAWEHLTAWHKGILNILGDSPLTNSLVQGDVH